MSQCKFCKRERCPTLTMPDQTPWADTYRDFGPIRLAKDAEARRTSLARAAANRNCNEFEAALKDKQP